MAEMQVSPDDDIGFVSVDNVETLVAVAGMARQLAVGGVSLTPRQLGCSPHAPACSWAAR
jgi:hypothetical protein